MSGQWKSEETPKVGQKCIIEVDSVNHPEGWWIGEITRMERHPNYIEVEADIIGLTDRKHSLIERVQPGVNYSVYPYSESWARVVESFLVEQGRLREKILSLTIQRDELRLAVRKP
ncbi:MAG: hypothetical protein WC911_02095 [Thermoleophilia bacterium]